MIFNYNIVNFDLFSFNFSLIVLYILSIISIFYLFYWFVLLSVKSVFFTVTDLLKNSQTAECKYF